MAAREAVLSQAKGLADTFNTLYDQLDKQNSQINDQLGALTTQVNSWPPTSPTTTTPSPRPAPAAPSPTTCWTPVTRPSARFPR